MFIILLMPYHLESQLNNYVNNTNNIKDEKRYIDFPLTDGTQKECKEIITTYQQECDKTNVLSNISQFYDNDFFNKYNKKINEINKIRDLKPIMEDYYKFKKIFNSTKDLEENKTIIIEDIALTCIKKRIEYKYRCLSEAEKKNKQQQKAHDREILRQIFYYTKFYELKELFVIINTKYKHLLNERNQKLEKIYKRRQEENLRRQEEDRIRQEEDRIRQEEDNDILLDSLFIAQQEVTNTKNTSDTPPSSLSPMWEQVLTNKEKKKKGNRKPFHK